MQRQKSYPRSKGSLLWSCVFHILLLAGFASIGLHLVYLYAEESLYSPQQRFLYQAFKDQPYKSTLDSFSSNKHFIIKTSCKECVYELIKHYCQTQNLPIVQKDITETKKYDYDLWSLRTLIRRKLDQKVLQRKAWVFIVSKYAPITQIQQLKVVEPNSKIFVISQNQLKVKQKDFTIIQINDFPLQNILKAANLPKKVVSVYASYYRNKVQAMFLSIDKQFQNIQTQLGVFYRPLSNLSQKCLDALAKLCKDEKLKSNKFKIEEIKQLNDVGVVLSRDKLLWKDIHYQLNYMLQKNENCTFNEKIVLASGKNQPFKQIQQKKDDNQAKNEPENKNQEPNTQVKSSESNNTEKNKEQQIKKPKSSGKKKSNKTKEQVKQQKQKKLKKLKKQTKQSKQTKQTKQKQTEKTKQLKKDKKQQKDLKDKKIKKQNKQQSKSKKQPKIENKKSTKKNKDKKVEQNKNPQQQTKINVQISPQSDENQVNIQIITDKNVELLTENITQAQDDNKQVDSQVQSQQQQKDQNDDNQNLDENQEDSQNQKQDAKNNEQSQNQAPDNFPTASQDIPVPTEL